ncbi:MAG TPA: DUF6498-containing protein [Woeseiaceae bacterium]|nr:DUF6498-containing protein [Woeseiaceae bacterium]
MDSVPTHVNQRQQASTLSARFGIGAASLLLANSGFLILFLVYDLSLYQLVVVYWCECFWVGAFSVLKLGVASLLGDPFQNRYVNVSRGSGLFLSFLTVWFTSGLFFSLLAMLGLLIFSPLFNATESVTDSPMENLSFLASITVLLAAAHGISFIANFLCAGEYKHARFGTLLALPFKRCLSMLGAAMLAAVVVYALPELASTMTFALVIIVMKFVADLRLHRGERASLSKGHG